MNRRLRATAVHLLFSAILAGLVSMLVFFVWYPAPYAAVSGGLSLFGLLVGVDVVLGPALTAVVAGADKPSAALRRDVTVIVAVQLAALGYGAYTMALARPMHMAFEVDRMRVVSVADVDPELLSRAPEAYRAPPWFGPRLIAAVKPSDPDEVLKSIDLALAGFDLGTIPAYWRDYSSQADAAWRAARPVDVLLAKYPQAADDVSRIAAAAGVGPTKLRFLPLISRRVNTWVTLIAEPQARVVGHLPFDGFF